VGGPTTRWTARAKSAGLHLLLALIATAPMIVSLPSRLVGHPGVDVWNHAWAPWFFWHQLSRGALPYHTDLLMAPDGGVIWTIDPVGAALATPLVPILGTVMAWNLLILGNVLLASWAVRRLALAIGASEIASWVASAALVCSPFLTSEIHNGVSEAVAIGWPLLALLACWRAIERDGLGDWALAGLALGVAGVASYYYGLAAGLLATGWWLTHRPERWRDRLLGSAVALAVIAVFLVPAGLAIQNSLADPGAIIARANLDEQGREFLLAHNAVDPRSFLWPGDFQSVDLASRGEAFRHSAYLGLVALGLALWSRRWRLLAAGLVVGVLALGPWLWWGGDWVTTASGGRVPLPMRLLDSVLPAVATTHFQRLCVPLLATVAALAALGATRLPRWGVLVACLAVAADGLLVGPSPWPIARADLMDTAAHRAIAARPAEQHGEQVVDAVLDLPVELGATMGASRYLTYQHASRRPIPNRIDPRYDTSTLKDAPPFMVLAAPSVERQPWNDILRQRLVEHGAHLNLEQLRQLGIQWIVLHTELCDEQEAALLQTQLEHWYGPPEQHGAHLLWATSSARAPTGGVHPRLVQELGNPATR